MNDVMTIVIKDETMIVRYEGVKGSRLVWRAAGLDVMVVGQMDKMQFETAGNFAINECLNRHIPVLSLRYQRSAVTRSNQSTDIDMYKKGLL